jgi:hypothetical protein
VAGKDASVQRTAKFFGFVPEATGWFGVDLKISASGEKPVEAARHVSGSRVGPVHDREWVGTGRFA